ncbi:hypothetical protein B566_EDAN006358 [Ephemera danica]|nr:hypothetical protein B566_EDAN006358 [Ephemera danica]
MKCVNEVYLIMEGNLADLLEGLQIAVKNKNEEKLKHLFDSIVAQAPGCSADAATFKGLVGQLKCVLEWEGEAAILAGAARSVAEIAKLDAGREACANCTSLMLSLLRLLSLKTDTSQDAISLQTQAFLKGGEGLEQLVKLLERARTIPGEPGRQLRNVSAGFLLNLLAASEETQKKAVGLNVLPLLSSFLETDCTDEEVPTHVLMILDLLADSGASNDILDERLCSVIVQVMGSTTSPEVKLVKTNLARTGLCELLLELLRKHKPLVQDDETRNLMKLACDLIILVLTGDESMELLYKEGDGQVFKEMIAWLESDDEDLQVIGVLAMGNFARTDKHCIHMVQKGVGKKLLRLVAKNNSAAGDIRLQHALLSALRNLAIPMQNKATLLSEGLVETVVPMASIPTFPVVFKLLGTLRMVVDSQEKAAKDLGMKEDLLKRLVQWCGTDDHPGVQGEANRLLAWLVKNSRSVNVARAVVEAGGLPCLVSMLSAEHIVMQNEALLALVLVAGSAKDLPSSATETLTGNAMASGILKFLQLGEKLEDPFLLNCLALLQLLAPIEGSKQSLREAGVPSALSAIQGNRKVAQQVSQVTAMLDSG